MTPLRLLKAAVPLLEASNGKYCLLGGHAASLYRSQERLTKDVDFGLVADPQSRSRVLAQDIIKRLGLTPMLGFIPLGPRELPREPICMVTSVPSASESKGAIDILLPELPWLLPAVERAHYNRLDLGFAHVPVITPEDLIIAKCYALNNAPDRFQDLDDLKEVFLCKHNLDLDYLGVSLDALNLQIPEAIRKYAPGAL